MASVVHGGKAGDPTDRAIVFAHGVWWVFDDLVSFRLDHSGGISYYIQSSCQFDAFSTHQFTSFEDLTDWLRAEPNRI